jgi:hypothetical protein
MTEFKGEYNLRWLMGTRAGWLISASGSARQLVVKDKIGRSAEICDKETWGLQVESKWDLEALTRKLGLELKVKEAPTEGLRYTIWAKENCGKLSWYLCG